MFVICPGAAWRKALGEVQWLITELTHLLITRLGYLINPRDPLAYQPQQSENPWALGSEVLIIKRSPSYDMMQACSHVMQAGRLPERGSAGSFCKISKKDCILRVRPHKTTTPQHGCLPWCNIFLISIQRVSCGPWRWSKSLFLFCSLFPTKHCIVFLKVCAITENNAPSWPARPSSACLKCHFSNTQR